MSKQKPWRALCLSRAAPDRAPEVVIPALALVVIASRPAEAAQAFAARHFSPAEVVSVESEGVASPAFAAARLRIAQRLSDGLLTVAVIGSDAADLSAALARLAHHHDVAAVALTLGREIAAARFPLGPRSYEAAHALLTPREWLTTRVIRQPLACDLRGESGPFDIIGDVHGCSDELHDLLTLLGYADDGAGRHATSRWATRRVRRRSGGSRPRRDAGGAAGDADGGGRAGVLRAGQSRHQADARAGGPPCLHRAWPAREPRPDRRAAQRGRARALPA